MQISLPAELLQSLRTLTEGAMILALLLIVVLAAVVVDLSDALYTARKLRQRLRSHRLRTTFAKLFEYWRVVIAGFLADMVAMLTPFYPLPFVAMLLTIGIIGVELRSLYEHSLRRKSHVAKLPDSLAALRKLLSDPGVRDSLSKLLSTP